MSIDFEYHATYYHYMWYIALSGVIIQDTHCTAIYNGKYHESDMLFLTVNIAILVQGTLGAMECQNLSK